MVDSVDELAYRLDSGPPTLLEGIEYLVGQLFGFVDRGRGTRSGRGALAGRGGFSRRAALAGRRRLSRRGAPGLGHCDAPFSTWVRALERYCLQRCRWS